MCFRMRTVGLLVAATLAAFAMLTSGCFARSEGQLGHASFSYESCLFGCAVTSSAMAAGGATATIQVDLANGYSFSQVKSSNPAVAQFAVGGGAGLSVSATSAAAGTTQLQLVDYNGKLVDQVTVTVKTTAKLATTRGWQGAAPLVLEGSTQMFHVTTVDASGNTLIGTGSVAFDVTAPLEKAGILTFGDEQGFTGHAGAGTITASAPATSVAQPITIVPLTALGSLTATVQANSSDSSGTYANVD
ncbi:MAG: hypothetical protein JWM53_1419, partial [bacterium]|nr:hypothetical protein [bacterium]